MISISGIPLEELQESAYITINLQEKERPGDRRGVGCVCESLQSVIGAGRVMPPDERRPEILQEVIDA